MKMKMKMGTPFSWFRFYILREILVSFSTFAEWKVENGKWDFLGFGIWVCLRILTQLN